VARPGPRASAQARTLIPSTDVLGGPHKREKLQVTTDMPEAAVADIAWRAASCRGRDRQLPPRPCACASCPARTRHGFLQTLDGSRAGQGLRRWPRRSARGASSTFLDGVFFVVEAQTGGDEEGEEDDDN
jgi:hypothetical protein